MAVYEAQATHITSHAYGGVGSRVAAFLVDGLAIAVFITIVTLGRPLPVATQGAAEAVNWHNALETAVGFAYFTLLWSWVGGGQTLGMRLFGLRVVGVDGEPIGYFAAVARWIGFVISAAVLLVGLVWAAFDPRRQGWHDKLVGTFVVRADAVTAALSTAAPRPTVVTRPHPIARGFAAITGVFGASLGLLGLGLAIAGDANVPVGFEVWAAGSLAVVAVIASAGAWWRPGAAAVAMALVVVGYWLALGSLVGPWWDGYSVAIANPVTEQQFWAAAPATAGFITSGIFIALAALLSVFGIGTDLRSGVAHPA